MPIGPGAFKTPADGRYHIRISGNPQYYTPAKNYTIKIEGIERPERFELRYTYIGFALIVIQKDADIENIPQEFLDSNSGLFSLLHDEALAKIVCGNMVIHTTSSPKSEIGIIWTAPPPGTGCIQFRATVIEHRDVWYMDDGPLSREFCEEDPQTEDTESMLNEKCCACSEARYELTFEGIWSRNTHPKDFPTNTLLTKFSDIIGASHNYNYRFWVYNEKASEAIRLVAEAGETQLLEAELQENRDHIRTIIKARGLSYPYLNNKTVSTFRVNTENHLISMVSMIQPSPDWFVGVSGIELCLADCSWIENRIINMYPWDAGTDSGATYTSSNQPTNPTDNIRRIKPDSPNDPRSPFYNELNENMEPIARLYITRQRIYDRPCPSSWYKDKNAVDGRITPTYTRNDDEEYGFGGGEDTDEGGGGGRVGGGRGGGGFGGGGFGGGGFGGRGYGGHGRGDGSGNIIPNREDEEEPAQCALSGWNEWSECSPKCGRGTQFRQREYLNPDAKEYCESANSHLQTTQQRDCSSYADCAGEIVTERPVESEEEIECEYSPWTIVERCNVTCGKGYLVKRRTVMAGTDCPQTEITDVCHKRKCRVPHFCYEEPIGDDEACDEDPRTFWFYNRHTLSCLLFSTKCNEHNNRFLTIDDCENVCIHARSNRNNE